MSDVKDNQDFEMDEELEKLLESEREDAEKEGRDENADCE